MKRLHEIIEVPRKVPEVFRFVADFGHIDEWDPGVVCSEKLTAGAIGLGSQFRVEVRSGLGTTEMRYTAAPDCPGRRRRWNPCR